RDPFLGTYAGTTGMRSADLPICPSPCRFLIVNMPAIDTTALFRSAPTRHVVVGAPASRYPWRADPNLDHPITVHVVAPSAYEFEVPASPGSGSFDLAAIVARQGDLEGRAVFFIIRRGG
ncbi:MAG: hypothetical protein K8H88_13625, partial [Sandaracinaceae bacterium]|nr:hypothetical protein [Sandaracinaceae bacterium]